jgi:hypothetical protein
MNIRSLFQKVVLLSTILLLLIIAWMALSGGFNQLSRSLTISQKVETILQIICGVLSVLNAFTRFYWLDLHRPISIAWMFSLAFTAGMSSIVWGPPMPFIGVLFAAVALMAAVGINSLLNIGRT